MIYADLVKTNRDAFLQAVRDTAFNLRTDPNFLMAVMESESGLNPAAVNPTGGATGLIQFMPQTAAALGTTTADLAAMSNVDQMYYVEKYFSPWRGRLNSYDDVYLVTFFPAAVGKPDDYVLQTAHLPAWLIAKQNPVFDLNKDQQITKGEFRQAIIARHPASIADLLKKKS